MRSACIVQGALANVDDAAIHLVVISARSTCRCAWLPEPGQPGNPGSEGIKAALEAGTITVADIDQMLRRRCIQMFTFGQFDTNFDALFSATTRQSGRRRRVNAMRAESGCKAAVKRCTPGASRPFGALRDD
jgi:hypothetical protein